MKKLFPWIATLIAICSIFITAMPAVSAKSFQLDYKTYKVKNKKLHKVNVADNNWSGVQTKINKVQVVTLAKKYKYESANDGTFNIDGFVRVHYIIKTSNNDVSIYPTQGTYSLDNGEQHEADSLENWDGDISKNVKKSGWVSIPVRNVKNIHSIRAKFDANYDTDDVDDDNQYKAYDLTVNF